MLASSPASMMNHCSLQKGIPYDSFRRENALGFIALSWMLVLGWHAWTNGAASASLFSASPFQRVDFFSVTSAGSVQSFRAALFQNDFKEYCLIVSRYGKRNGELVGGLINLDCRHPILMSRS